MNDIILETLLDSFKLLPFLFFAFLIIEFVEHKLKKSKAILSTTGKYGPFIGAFLGAFPQCGFSVLATNLYVTRIISLGTLISIYLSTSDEMLPILIANKADAVTIFTILGIKIIIAMVLGFLIDLVLRKKAKKNMDFNLCQDTCCNCKSSSIVKSSIIHTIKTFVLIIIVNFVLNVIFHYKGNEFLSNLFLNDSNFSSFISSLIALIPNCGSSVLLTELFLSNVISFGTLIGGLLSGSGVALVVLFKTNKNLKENLLILLTIYLIGAITGFIINLIL